MKDGYREITLDEANQLKSVRFYQMQQKQQSNMINRLHDINRIAEN